MWIFRVKQPPGSPPAFKARYVVRGFCQRQGVDYFQTFSPTPKMTTLRGSLNEEIWLRRPPGFTGSFSSGTQWSLRRPVYGLREVPREWHDTLRTTLAALGFTPSTTDPSFFLCTDTSLPPFYVLVYVDDLVFATADTEALTLVKSELQKRHTCTNLGELRSYLGLQITRDRARRTIILTRSHMVHQVLQRFGFQFSSPQPTPLSTGHSLSAPPSDESVEPSGPYPELQLTKLRILLAIAAMNRKKLRQIDVANAFLYTPVDAEIFVELPHRSNAGPNQVCQLEKSLYGIKQAPRLWQQHLHARLIHIGFLQLPHDQGMYRLTKGADYILLIVYVNDLCIGSTDAITTWFEGELQRDVTLTVATTVFLLSRGVKGRGGPSRGSQSRALPPPPLFLAPGPPPVDPLPPQGPAPSGVSQVDAVEPVEVAVDSGAATGAEPAGAGSGGAGSGGAETEGAEPGGAGNWGAETGGAETWGAEPGGAATGCTEPWGAEPGGTEPRGAEHGGAGSARVAPRGASSRREVLSPQELREWFARRWGRTAGAGGTTAATGSGGTCPGGAGAAGPGGTAEAAGVGPTGGSAGASGGTGAAGSAGPGAAGATGVGAAGVVGAGGSADDGTSEGAGAGAAGAGGATGAGAPAGSPGAVPAGSGGAPRPRPYFVPLLEQVLGLPPSPGLAPPFECPQPVQTQSLLQPASPLPAPSPYTGPTGGLAERRAPASCPASTARPACTSRRTSRPRPPAVPGTHQMALRPSTAPLRVPLPSPPASSLPAFPDPESDSLRAASPTVARFLATVVTDPSLASTAASALVTELVDFAARCRLDYAASLVAESASVCPPSVGGTHAAAGVGSRQELVGRRAARGETVRATHGPGAARTNRARAA
ncbi:unnamed protein product [Closterium sp. NIES-54]